MKDRKTKILLILVLMLIILFVTCCRTTSAITTLEIQEKESNWTPLHKAVVEGDKEKVQSLINEGANVNARETKRGQTPLHFAALLGRTEIFKLLFENGADPDMKDNNEDGQSPLEILDIIERLNQEAPP